MSLFCFQSLYAHQPLEEYFSYLNQLGQSTGDCKAGEIEITTDPREIFEIQGILENRLLRKGFSQEQAREFSRIGVVREDQHWIWLRDAVYFPRGIPGTYDRLIWKSSLEGKSPGVAVLPILPSGQIVLNLNYRHATRSWELELPWGCRQSQETNEEAALREVKEETGMIVTTLLLLGEMAPDTGALSSIVPIFLGKISSQEESTPEYSESIAGLLIFTKEELQEGFMQGFLEVSLNGEKRKVPLRDSLSYICITPGQIPAFLLTRSSFGEHLVLDSKITMSARPCRKS